MKLDLIILFKGNKGPKVELSKELFANGGNISEVEKEISLKVSRIYQSDIVVIKSTVRKYND